MPWEYLLKRRYRDRHLTHIGGWKDDVTKDLPQIGRAGWELVAISPEADAQGLTTEEVWVFKRPAG